MTVVYHWIVIFLFVMLIAYLPGLGIGGRSTTKVPLIGTQLILIRSIAVHRIVNVYNVSSMVFLSHSGKPIGDVARSVTS